MRIDDLYNAKAGLMTIAILGGAKLDVDAQANEIDAVYITKDEEGKRSMNIWFFSDSAIKTKRDVQIMVNEMDQAFGLPFDVHGEESLQDRANYLAENFKDKVENDVDLRPNPLQSRMADATAQNADQLLEEFGCGGDDCIFLAAETNSAVDRLRRQLLAGYMVWACGEKQNPIFKPETAFMTAQNVYKCVEEEYLRLKEHVAEKGE